MSQEEFAQSLEKGYFGEVPAQVPDSAHTLATGPDGPPLAPDDRTRFEQPMLASDAPASGGAVQPGTVAVVGEQGPENTTAVANGGTDQKEPVE